MAFHEDDPVRKEQVTMRRFEIALHEALGAVAIAKNVREVGDRCGGRFPLAFGRPAPKIPQTREIGLVRNMAGMGADNELGAIGIFDT